MSGKENGDAGYVSVSRPTYERLRAWCDANGVSMARVVEVACAPDRLEEIAPVLGVALPEIDAPATEHEDLLDQPAVMS